MSKYDTLLTEIKKIPHIKKTVIANKNGMILASDSNSSDEDGAIAVFLGNAGATIGQLLGMDSLEMSLCNTAANRLVVMNHRDTFCLFVLDKQMSFAEFEKQICPIVRQE